MSAMLTVDNLSIHYGVIQAVKNVSFEVNEGEVVTLIGANGAVYGTPYAFCVPFQDLCARVKALSLS